MEKRLVQTYVQNWKKQKTCNVTLKGYKKAVELREGVPSVGGEPGRLCGETGLEDAWESGRERAEAGFQV